MEGAVALDEWSLPQAAGAEAEPSAPASPAPPELRIAGLAKTFEDGTRVLEGVDLEVRPGESVALIGANGAGKSTLLRCALRLIEPTGGRIAFLGDDITAMPRHRLRRLRARVGFVFQRHNLVSRVSALSNVVHGAQAREFGPRAWCHGLAPKAVREEAMHCLERVGLADIAGRRADRLSGGQSQRVAIARALIQRPRFFIADEPVASLDPAAGEEVMNLFTELLRQDGTSLLYTSHNLVHAVDYADRVVALKGGRVAFNRPAAGLDRRRLEAVYE